MLWLASEMTMMSRGLASGLFSSGGRGGSAGFFTF
jgi:hypothetical protein